MEIKNNNKIYLASLYNGIELFNDIFSMFKNKFSALIVLSFINSLLEGLGLTLIVSMLQYSSINELKQSESVLLNFLFETYNHLGIDNLQKSIFFLIFILFLTGIIYLIQARIGCLIQTEYSYRWRERLINKVFHSDWYKISNYKSGLFINAITTETSKLSGAVFEIKLFVSTLIYIIFYTIFTITITWKLTFLILFSGLFIYLFSNKYVQKNHSDASNLLDQNKDLQTGLIENMFCHKYIKATGSEKFALDKLISNINKLKYFDFKTSFRPQINKVLVEFSAILFILLSIIISFLYLNIKLAEMSLVIIAFVRIMPRVISIQHSFFTLINTKPSFDQLRKINNILELKTTKNKRKILKSNIVIKFNNYDFIINKRKILDKINLSVLNGEYVGITGDSGSGKSTLLNSIAGLYGNNSKIQINLKKGYNSENINQKIGYVSQDNFLINSSIFNNICWGRTFSNFEVLEAIRLAGLEKVINKLQKGLETNLGDTGAFFSGGEKQRISLARELIKKPQILLLDEPTSALDKTNENSIINTINILKGQTTIIITSHSLNNLKLTDYIINMDGGKIISKKRWNEINN
tara:strand:+ start:32 stop:1777 length:1746 start_codon:yes stop_codon:yes gene_type:complete